LSRKLGEHVDVGVVVSTGADVPVDVAVDVVVPMGLAVGVMLWLAPVMVAVRL